MCSFSSPKAPAVAPAAVIPEVPTQADATVQAAGDNARRRAAAGRGFGATLLSDPLGLGAATTSRTTLLGGATTNLG